MLLALCAGSLAASAPSVSAAAPAWTADPDEQFILDVRSASCGSVIRSAPTTRPRAHVSS